MNRKQRRIAQSQEKHKSGIRLGGTLHTVEEAGMLAITEHQRGNSQAAIEIYQRVLAHLPGNTDAYNNQAVILHDTGRYKEALACCDKAIALKPDCAAFHYNHGNTLQMLMRYEDALASYDKVLALKPDYFEAVSNRGATLKKIGRYEEALACCDRAIALKPDYAVAINNRSVILQELRRYEESLASCDRAIAIKPDYADAYNNRGIVLQKLCRYEESLTSCQKALALKPDYAEAYNNLGVTLQQMKRYEESLACCDKAIALKPDYGEAYNNRGIALNDLKRYDEAIESYNKAILLKPGHANSYSNLGIILHELKRYDEALASCDKAIALKSDYADAHQLRGSILANQGKMEEAKDVFHNVLALEPGHPKALFSVAHIRKYQDADDPDVKTILERLDNSGEGSPDRDYLYFALGKIYDDCGRYDDAFAAYRQANNLLRAEAAYHPAETEAYTNRIIATFTKEFLAQRFSFSSGSHTPIFIVGMPRSGTTLLASVLSNHPAVATAGELPTMTEFTLRAPELQPYPQAVTHLAPAAATRLIKAYEERLKRDDSGNHTYIIDKHPFNFMHLGLIALLFPCAHIIHCMRRPLDSGLSNYFQRFSLSYSYSFDLAGIGHFYGQYARLMEHWHKVLPVKMAEILYRDMVSNTESEARRMLDFLGLEWDERCLSPHTNRNAVETASKWQVRQPIYKQSVERWRHYEKHLNPLKEALKAAGCYCEP